MRGAFVALLFLSRVCASETQIQIVRTGDGAALQVASGEPLKLATSLPTKALNVRIDAESRGRAMVVSIIQENESKPQVSVWIARQKSSWSVLREWSAKNTTHEFAFDATDSVTRKSHCVNVESVPFALDCGCCNALQTRTIETIEEETLAWNEKTREVAQAKFARWYITQPGEGMLNIVRKLYGDASKLARVYRLNPELQKQTTLKCGQRILIDQFTADRPN